MLKKSAPCDSALPDRSLARRSANSVAVCLVSATLSAAWSVTAYADDVTTAATTVDASGNASVKQSVAAATPAGTPGTPGGPSVGVDASIPVSTVPAVASDQPWLHQTLSIINSSLTRFGPYRTGNTYLEYEYYGFKGPFDLYGYVDALKVFGAGTQNTTGVWDKGAPIFSEQEPRVALDTLAGQNFQVGPFKHIYLASDWIYEQGASRSSDENTLYMGLGTDIDTHTPLSLSANIYANREWQNYGEANEYSWDGYRFQMNYFYPLGHYLGGDISYAGFFNYDFGSKLREEAGGNTYSDTEFDETNALVYSHQHLRLVAVARYFHNGGQWNGTMLNFGNGNFPNRSTGWGYYLEVGYQWGKI
jgi:nucleoside-specific channel-forming protein